MHPDPAQHHHSRTATVGITLAAVCILASVYVHLSGIARDAREGVQTEQSKMSYMGKWQPTRLSENGQPPLYFPGESVFFHTKRHVRFVGHDTLPLLVASSFQNVETGFEYGLPPVARILTKEGDLSIDTVRVLPPSIPSGRYKVVGWAKTETERRPAFAIFESEEIQVGNTAPK